MPRARSPISVLALGLLSTAVGRAAPADDAEFFANKVRPILAARCFGCHGPEKQRGGLRLDARAAILAGGERGAALVPGKPDASLLIRAVGHGEDLKMPPKTKLPEGESAILRDWVRRGAPWTADASSSPAPLPNVVERPLTPEERAFWAFQPVRRPVVPVVESASFPIRNPIDAFVLARLRDAGLSPAPPADRRTLLRRVTFDLTGLPPTPEEFDLFLRDTAADAYERVVERLLASPAHGEKWGRRWLDVARYADSNGMDENLAYVHAWRYRDYVVKSFNADKPYDVFVREQIAGDLLDGPEAERADRLTATGFLVLGPKMLAEDDPMKMRMDIVDEQVDAVGQAFLGLTLGCARCHDHKFDPIRAADYYGLAGFFYSTKAMRNYSVVAVWHERPLGTPEDAALLAAHEKKVAAAKADIAAAEKRKASADEVKKLRDAATALEKARPPVAEAMAVEDAEGKNLRVHLRGNHLTLGAEVPRRVPRVFGDAALPPLGADRSGRRELAAWLTRPDHPLTPRVLANRVWAGHFGNGLVRSADNFGRLGDRPTHPELLDWLASELVASQWSLKHLHRLVVTSSTYRTASRVGPTDNPTDPDNRFLAHFPRRRLDAEEVRDALLAAAGLLDRTMGGSLLTATPRQYVTGTANKNYENYAIPRRSIYLPVVRSAVFDVLQTLDFPDPSVPNGRRATTTIPTQALLMLNSSLGDQTAEALAKGLLAGPGDDVRRIGDAYRRALGRMPTKREVERVLVYLKASESAVEPAATPETRRLRTWRGLARVLLASNEFVFVE